MHYCKAEQMWRQAAELYKRQHNDAAYAESAYGAAEALCKRSHYAPAEKLLQQTLHHVQRHPNSFHAAHIYSLLGLIYMETDRLPEAEHWLQKSLALELQNKRYNGAATDSINLAIIKQLHGDIQQARQISQQALDYAQKTNDAELIELIKSKMLH